MYYSTIYVYISAVLCMCAWYASVKGHMHIVNACLFHTCSYIWLLWLLGCGNAAPCVSVCVCGMPRIVALAINLRHSQPKKKLCKCGKRSKEREGKPFFFFLSLPFAILMGFWALIKFKQLATYLCLPTAVAASVNWPQMPLTSQEIKERDNWRKGGRWRAVANKVHYPVLTCLHFPAGFALILMTLPLQAPVNIDSANWRRGPWPMVVVDRSSSPPAPKDCVLLQSSEREDTKAEGF